jgi:spore maturation protein CgeB
VVGGPWNASALRRLCLSANIPAERTARLYQQTEIVLNVFREKHHFNAQRVAAGSMNPRIYEALACGAAVLTERRDEVTHVFPEMPQFETPQELVGNRT